MFDQAALVEATQELEPLPPTVHQLAAIASRRNLSAMEAEEAISMDPALRGKLPGLANPVAGGSRVEVVSIRDAVGERLEQVLSTYLSRPVATPRVAPRVDVFDAAPGHQSLVRVPPAFDLGCIPKGRRWASGSAGSHTAGIFPRHASFAWRIASPDATGALTTDC